MGKVNDKQLDRKLDDSSLEQVSGGNGGTSTESKTCPRCNQTHNFKSLGSAIVSYKSKWIIATKYSCDNVWSALSTFYKVVDPVDGTVWLDVNFEAL